MKKLIIMGLISLIAHCCSKTGLKDDFLTIPRTPYNGNELRIDGFYYQQWDNGAMFSDITWFYNDGIVFQGNGSGNMSELIDYANKTFLNHEMKQDKKGFWGLFLVKDNKIIYERWVGTQNGYLVYREEGNIINDTTFVMTEVSRMEQGVKSETKPIERLYYFNEFSSKPDSTNNVIGTR